jgi:hypothetical protein
MTLRGTSPLERRTHAVFLNDSARIAVDVVDAMYTDLSRK